MFSKETQVLVVDDSLNIRRIVVDSLQRLGFSKITTAEDAVETSREILDMYASVCEVRTGVQPIYLNLVTCNSILSRSDIILHRIHALLIFHALFNKSSGTLHNSALYSDPLHFSVTRSPSLTVKPSLTLLSFCTFLLRSPFIAPPFSLSFSLFLYLSLSISPPSLSSCP